VVVDVVCVAGVEEIKPGSVSRCAHFKRSMDTVSVRLPRSTLKYFGDCEMILNGPSYGGYKGFRTASRRMKMCVHVCRSFGTCDLWRCGRSGGGFSSLRVRLKRST
jgi:hypothetical protein